MKCTHLCVKVLSTEDNLTSGGLEHDKKPEEGLVLFLLELGHPLFCSLTSVLLLLGSAERDRDLHRPPHQFSGLWVWSGTPLLPFQGIQPVGGR